MKHHVLRWVAVFAALICFGIAAFFAWQIYQQEREYKEGDEAYSLIEQMAASSSTEEAPETTPGLPPSLEGENTESQQEEVQESAEPTVNPEAALIPSFVLPTMPRFRGRSTTRTRASPFASAVTASPRAWSSGVALTRISCQWG